MKKRILLLVAAPVLCCAQHYNPFTNAIDNSDVVITDSNAAVSSNAPATNLAGIPCNPNTFWAIGLSGIILEYTLNGNTITFSDTVFPMTGYRSLGCANNLMGGSFSPTFYTHIGNGSAAVYYNGASWDTVTSANPYEIYNNGGLANHMYYQAKNSGLGIYLTNVLDYDGSNFNSIYAANGGKYLAVADLAIDAAGNIYFPVFTNWSTSDSLIIISPSGNIIAQYPFVIDFENAYGSFILNNTYYIGLGSGNSVNPETLLPVTFTGTSAVIGTPIPFPGSGNFIDMESCNQGMPLGIVSANSVGNDIYITNPVKDICSIRSTKDKIIGMYIYDKFGKIIFASEKTQAAFFTREINCTAFAKGIYVMSLQTEKERFVKKFAKE